MMLCFFIPHANSAEKLQPRVEVNGRYGSQHSILMTEFWMPFLQGDDSVFYGDLRLMGNDQGDREGNLGAGYRKLAKVPVLGEGAAGAHAWIDRRVTDRGSTFHQATVGAEWLGKNFDVLANGYIPLSEGKEYDIPNANPQGPALVGTGIIVDTNGRVLEEPQHGLDLELGWQAPLLKESVDSVRLYGGGYYFNSDNTENVAGWRTRLAVDVTSDISIGGRFQRDDERGSQAFLEATIRFPFGNKKSFRREGIRSRLDDSPERDIDIVTGDVVVDSGERVPVLNQAPGQAQQVIHVDNTAAGGGDGTVERPYNTLAAGAAAVQSQGILYIHAGDSTTTGQNQGVTLNTSDVTVIGAGTDFMYDSGRFTTKNGATPTATLLAAASSAPVISNVNANSDGITISANNVTVSGVSVSGAMRDGIAVTGNNAVLETLTTLNNIRHGIYALNVDSVSVSSVSATGNGQDGVRLEASGNGNSLTNGLLSDVVATGNRNGVRFYAHTNASLTGGMAFSQAGSNTQHGVIVYDDSTAGAVDVDLGGGTFGSSGLNIFVANTLEDLALDIDGAALAARNNWWGQASGPDQDNPSVGIRPQIYYGAPINDGLIGHWTFDTEWLSGTTAYDRSGNAYNGTMQDGLTSANAAAGYNRQALTFDGLNDRIHVPFSDPFEYMGVGGWTVISNLNSDTADVDRSYIVSKPWNANGTYNYALRVEPNNVPISDIAGQSFSGLAFPGGAPIVPQTWNQLAMTVGQDRTLTNYKNGAAANSGTHTVLGFLPPAAGGDQNRPLSIGTIFPYNAPWAGVTAHAVQGQIDDVRIYNRAISAAEMAEIYRMNTTSTIDTGGFLSAAP